MMNAEADGAVMLAFDNGHPLRLTLDELLAEAVQIHLVEGQRTFLCWDAAAGSE